MAAQLQLRRGSNPANASFLGALAELTFNLDTLGLHIHDGVTEGGIPVSGHAIVLGDGVTDNTLAVVKANSFGIPIRFVGISVITAPVTITSPIVDGVKQIFSTASKVTIDNGQPVRPEWWGDGMGTWALAALALPQPKGGTVLFRNGQRYKPAGHYYGIGTDPGNFLSRENITLDGEGLPWWATDCSHLVGGAVIEGTVLIYGNNPKVRNLGVDTGLEVVNNYYGGVVVPAVHEGLLMTYGNDALKAASAVRRGGVIENVRGLCRLPDDPTHAMLLSEGYVGTRVGGVIEACYGTHGAVVKADDFGGASITSYLNKGEGTIIKTDSQASAVAKSVRLGRVRSHAQGPAGTVPHTALVPNGSDSGTRFNPMGGNITNVYIESIEDYGHSRGIEWTFGAGTIIDTIQIGSVLLEGNGAVGANFAVPAGCSARFVQIGNFVARNQAGTALYTDHGVVQISSMAVVNAQMAVLATGTASPNIDKLLVHACAAVARIEGDARPCFGTISRVETPAFLSAGLQPSLLHDWLQWPYQSTFMAQPGPGVILLNGLLQPSETTTSNEVFMVPFWARPEKPKRVWARGRNVANVESLVPLTISTDGRCIVNELAGGIANCDMWLSLDGVSYKLTD